MIVERFEWDFVCKYTQCSDWHIIHADKHSTVNVIYYLLRDDYVTGIIRCWDYSNGTYRQDHYAPLVAQTVESSSAMWESWVWSLGWGDPLEKGMATHSSILAWRISWTEEPGGYSPWGLKESDTTQRLTLFSLSLWQWQWGWGCLTSAFFFFFLNSLSTLGLDYCNSF